MRELEPRAATGIAIIGLIASLGFAVGFIVGTRVQ